MIVPSNNEIIWNLIKGGGVPASSLSQLRGSWPENIEEPWPHFGKKKMNEVIEERTPQYRLANWDRIVCLSSNKMWMKT